MKLRRKIKKLFLETDAEFLFKKLKKLKTVIHTIPEFDGKWYKLNNIDLGKFKKIIENIWKQSPKNP